MARNELLKYYRKCNPCAQSLIIHHCSLHGRNIFLIIIGDGSHWLWNGWSKSEGWADPNHKQSFPSVRRITKQPETCPIVNSSSPDTCTQRLCKATFILMTFLNLMMMMVVMMTMVMMVMMMMMTPPWCLIAVRQAESRLGKHQFAKFHNGKKVKHLEAEKLNC